MSKFIEEWRPIEGYEGLYEVSDWGNVRNRFGKSISKEMTKDGYLRVNLHKNGHYKHHSVHRLVAKSFIPNPENKPCVGHTKPLPNGTEDKTSNEAWNIEWMTYSENRNYGTCNERISAAQKDREFTEEHKKNISEALRNSEIFHNLVKSDEYRQKLRDAHKKNPQFNRKDLSQPVHQYTLDGTYIKTYPSAKEAARQTGLAQSNISRCCNGGFLYKGKWINVSNAYGFKWTKGTILQAPEHS